MSRRLFLAVALDDELRHGLAAFLDDNVGDGSLPGRRVPAESWHVTLRFLGWCDDAQGDRVVHELAETVDVAPFRVGFAGLGAFPKASRATVVWLGVDRGARQLIRLAELAEAAAVTAGLAEEDRPFHPHLTLSRVRPPQDVTGLVSSFPPFPLTQRVGAVTLFVSHPGRGGARYEAVDEVQLS